MTRVDVHPEDLLDAAHRGELDDAQRARLAQHTAHCAACAAEVALIDDFDVLDQPGDEALIDRLVEGAIGQAPPVEARPTRKTAAGAGRTILYAVAASLLLGAFGGAAAAMFAMWPARVAEEEPAPEPTVTLPEEEPPPARRARRRVVEAPVEEEIVEEEIVEEAPEPEPEARPARIPSAEELLAAANRARRDHRYPQAVRLYRRLQTAHPRSREAALSHVTLGRLLLDGTHDPRGALREFERYLAQGRHRVLDEEARVGRALALMRLGRREEERRAWRELLAHHPDTLHAERANSRAQ
ncbi:MAG: hypothetical protein VYE22_05585 [Myxococcota bacterium]|nr:hypothetical protein [Myxococcota bacterium]